MKRVIILERIVDPLIKFKYALWAEPKPEDAIYFAGYNRSAYRGILPEEQAALENGTLVERVGEYSAPQGTPMATIANDLKTLWNNFNAEIQNYNPNTKYGLYWDGTSWQQG